LLVHKSFEISDFFIENIKKNHIFFTHRNIYVKKTKIKTKNYANSKRLICLNTAV